MGTEAEIPADLKACLESLSSVVNDSIRIVDAIIGVIIEHEAVRGLRTETVPLPNKVTPVLALMFQALGSSSYTLLRLSGSPGLQTRDCFSIARSIVELATNICYIIAEGEEAAEKAIRHAQQKSYTDLERVSEIGNMAIRVAYKGKPDASTIDGMEEAIREFTSRTGREKGWTDLSIDARIDATGTRLGEGILNFLHIARFMIYRHSSEILHGTYFSALYFFGVTRPSGESMTQRDFAEHVGQQHMMILMAVVFSLAAAIQSFHKAFGFQFAQDKSVELLDSLSEIAYLNPKTEE